MKKIVFSSLFIVVIHGAFAQSKTLLPWTAYKYEKIREQDFSQLIGAQTPGFNVDFSSEKATLSTTFTAYKNKSLLPFYIQATGSIGTTNTVLELGSTTPFDPDWSAGVIFSKLIRNKYFYDGSYTAKASSIRTMTESTPVSNNALRLDYTDALKKKILNGAMEPADKLHISKQLDWLSLTPNYKKATYTFYDRSLAFASQINKPVFETWSIEASFNHYWWVNNEDVKWKSCFTTRFFFYKIGLKFGDVSNIEALKKTTINDVSYSDTVNGAVRQKIKSTSAYDGKYDHYFAVMPNFEILYSFVDFFAFNFFGNYNIVNDASKCNGNLAGGLYFVGKQTGSKFNIGVFYQRSLGVSPNKELIGIKTKVPINW